MRQPNCTLKVTNLHPHLEGKLASWLAGWFASLEYRFDMLDNKLKPQTSQLSTIDNDITREQTFNRHHHLCGTATRTSTAKSVPRIAG